MRNINCIIKDLLSTNTVFQSDWVQLSESQQKEITDDIQVHYQQYASEAKETVPLGYEEVIGKSLVILPKTILALSKYKIENLQSQLCHLFFHAYKVAKPQEVDELFEIITKSNISTVNLNKILFDCDRYLSESFPLIQDLIRNLRILEKVEQTCDGQKIDLIYDHLRNHLYSFEPMKKIFDDEPKLYWRLQKYNFLPLFGTEYSNPDHLMKLFDLCEAISPADVSTNMNAILNSLEMNPTRASQLINLFSWAHDRIIEKNTDEMRKKMSTFADQLLALLWDNPKLADLIFILPSEKYDKLVSFLEGRSFEVKANFELLSISDFNSFFNEKKTDDSEKKSDIDQKKSQETYFKFVEKMIETNESVKEPFHFWLNTILKLHGLISLDKTSSLDLKEKLEKLPSAYLGVIKKMFDLSQKNPRFLEPFLSFAIAFPFSETLSLCLDILTKYTFSDLDVLMSSFNELVAENPNWLTKLISNLLSAPELLKLKDIDRPLFELLLSQPENLRNDILVKLIEDKNTRDALTILFQLEEKHGVCLTSIFLNSGGSFSQLKDPLFKIICENKLFATQLSQALSSELHNLHSFQEKPLILLNDLLVKNPSIVFELFEITLNSNNALKTFLQIASRTEHFFEEEKQYQNDIQQLFHLLKQFHRSFKATHKESIARILWLIENEQYKLALRLIKIQNQENLTSLLHPLLELVTSYYIQEIEQILERLDKNPDDAFIRKLLSISPEKYAPLISHCLKLDQIKDKEWYDFVLTASLETFTKDGFFEGVLAQLEGDKTLATAKLEELKQFEKPKSVTAFLEAKETESVDYKELVTSILSFCQDEDIIAIGTEELSPQQRLKISLGIASVLISDQGKLNTNLIEHIKKSGLYVALNKSSPFFIKHLDYIFSVLKAHPEFGEILDKLHLPEQDSISDQIIRNMQRMRVRGSTDELSHDKGIAVNQAKAVSIATLLCPVRQDSVGSCFATSVVIQAYSSPDGLLQLLEDYVSLLSQNQVRRFNAAEPERTKCYPMLFDFEEFAKKFRGENLLSRAYEFTLATMSVDNDKYSLKVKTATKLQQIFESQLREYFSRSSIKESEELIEGLIKLTVDSLKQAFDESCLFTYNGHVQHRFVDYQGAWLLFDKESRKPLNNDKELQLQFYLKMFKKAKTMIMKSSEENSKVWDEIFDKILPDLVHSPDFNMKLQNESGFGSLNRGLGRLNPVKYDSLNKVTAYAEYRGGDLAPVLANYHGRPPVTEKINYDTNPLKLLESIATRLDSKQETSEFLSIQSNTHAFNLDVQYIKLIREKGADAIIKELQEKTEQLAQTKMTESLANYIINAYTSIQKFPNQESSALHKKLLLKNLSFYETLDDLCQEIVRLDREMMGESRDCVGRVLDWIIRLHPDLGPKSPHIYQFADTNWEGASRMGLSCYLTDRSIHYVFTSAKGEIQPLHWAPPNICHWNVVRHGNGKGQLHMKMFQSKRSHEEILSVPPGIQSERTKESVEKTSSPTTASIAVPSMVKEKGGLGVFRVPKSPIPDRQPVQALVL